jgi:xanthine dehydrogenase YagT iron-sulfur-binding subunit
MPGAANRSAEEGSMSAAENERRGEPPKREVSRRAFIKGVGGLVGAGAMAPGLLGSVGAAQTPATRAGIRLYPAGGEAIRLSVNGQMRQVRITPNTTLLQALRENCDLTGGKEVCSRGACGACTVLLDGRSVNSCLLLAVDAIGHEVTTVEGLVKDGVLDAVPAAFVAHDACQCGYCIPGFVVRSRALIDENKNPSLEEIKRGLSGNICRCGTYHRIFDAVAAAAKGGAS